MEALSLTGIIGTGHHNLAVLEHDSHQSVEVVIELALGALDVDVVALDGHFDSGRNRNGVLTDTRHI